MLKKVRLYLYTSQRWQRRLQILLLAMLGLIFTLSFHILPAESKLTQFSEQSIREKVSAPTNPEQLIQQGRTFYQAEKFTQAAESLQQAAQIYESQKDDLNQALALSYLSLTQQKLGLWNQAKATISSSLKLLTKAKPTTKEAKQILALALNTQGSLQLALGQAELALESWQQAAKTYTQIGDTAGHIGSLINQATALESLGFSTRMMNIWQQVEQNLQAQPDSLLKVLGLRSLGNTLRVRGDLEKSQQLLEQSLAMAQNMELPQEESATLLSLGNTLYSFGNKSLQRGASSEENSLPLHCNYGLISENAKTYYQNAADLYYKSASKSTSAIAKIQAQLNRLTVLLSLGQNLSNEELELLQSNLAELTPSRAVVYAQVNFARSLVCLNEASQKTKENSTFNVDKISQILTKAVQQAQDLQDQRSESYALGNLGQLYEQTKQLSLAQQYSEQALNLAQVIDASDIAFEWQWQLGRLLLAQGNSQAAVAAYTEAVTTLKSLRTDLVSLNSDLQFDLRDRVEPVYRQLVGLLLQPEKPSLQNLKQARDVIEALQLAQLDNFFRDACSIVQPTSIDEVVNNANPATAVIYPIILADRVEVIVKLPHIEQLHHYRTYKAKSEVETVLEQLQKKLKQRYTFSDRQALSQQVYNWLIQPLEADLAQNQIKTLVFVLDGSLRNIPMATLYNGKQYLIEKYSVALSPGLQLLEPKSKPKRFEALIGGLTQSRFGFSSLPNVADEFKEIQAVIPSKEFINQAFTNKTIEKEVSSLSYPVVHLATHGKFSSQQEDTFILTWNGKINVKELREVLQTREPVVGRASQVPSPIELLVLSACETATGDKRAALGLAGVAVRSGARTTLASLWQVDDKSTAMLMREFYRQLKNNPALSKSEALRRAQEFIFQNYQEHPFYWAPYVLVGNWL
ncbi:CHAT domain-containing protein [Nostoc sp. DSM 114161]|jgi:CHAT domain-containing protein|uniref:CHAT domain-containing protein n=1 Tax=Nostoc sp. DSM 114161 TaxID=3440143 RepID=UPI0040463A98